MFTGSPYFFMVGYMGKVKWFKKAGVYYMIFKVPCIREEVGDPLDIHILLTMIFHPPNHFLERVERR